MLLDPSLTLESGGDHDRLQMVTPAGQIPDHHPRVGDFRPDHRFYLPEINHVNS
jgi:hypothetical protein